MADDAPETPRLERPVAPPEALSSVAAEAPAPVLSLEARLAHLHPLDAVVGEQGEAG